MSDPQPDAFPRANVTAHGPRASFREARLAWGLAAGSCVAAALIVAWALAGSGSRVEVRFLEGHGLKPRDPVKYRGIVVGEVESVGLAADMSGLVVKARLLRSAEPLARVGTRFWIERPRFSIGEIRSPGTLVGGCYLAAAPGAKGGEAAHEFVGVESPPESVSDAAGGLEIILECDERLGLEPGSSVTYRGIVIGKVLSVGLSSDAVRVEARVHIGGEYRALVRTNTCFWRSSGIDMSWGLFSGLEMDVESLSTLTSGGVSLATPDEPAAAVTTGRRFVLHAKRKDEWLSWAPQIALGSSLLPDGAPRPQPSRVSLSWREPFLIGSRLKQVSGWALLMEGGILLGPADLLVSRESAVDGASNLAWRGTERALSRARASTHGQIALLDVSISGAGDARPWPATRTRRPDEPEDCAVFADPRKPATALSLGRLSAHGDAWDVDGSVSFDDDWHGAAVLSRRDGSLVGILLVRELETARIALVPTLAAARGDQKDPAE